MREIGSEFWDVPVSEHKNKLFPESTQWFLSGRSAHTAIIKDIKKKKEVRTVAMPSWCCDSMIIPFLREGIEVKFYPVYWQDGLVQEIALDCDALFLMDYFGYTGPASDLSGYKGIVIRDVTHSLFSSTYDDADYYFGSLRKWCGVWTGGYAWGHHQLKIESGDDYGYTVLREIAMQQKNSYINGYPGFTDKGYLKVFVEAEECLEKVDVAPAVDRDIFLVGKLDVEGISERRRRNAEILRAAFSEILIFSEFKDADCPMFVPIFVPNGRRDELRRYLIKQEIYCPIHWPVSKYHKPEERELTIYQNELSLVCDQRYSEEDMDRVVNTIKGGGII